MKKLSKGGFETPSSSELGSCSAKQSLGCDALENLNIENGSASSNHSSNSSESAFTDNLSFPRGSVFKKCKFREIEHTIEDNSPM